MKKYLLISSCVASLSTYWGADNFKWSDSKYDLNAKTEAIRAQAYALREYFPTTSDEILERLGRIKLAATSEAAIEALDATIREVLTERPGGPAKVLEKYIPAKTRVERTVEHKCEYIKEWSYSDYTYEMNKKIREAKSRGDVDIESIRWSWQSEIPGVVMAIPLFGWALGATDYKGEVYYNVVTCTTVVTRAARTERRELSDILRLFQELRAIVVRQQTQRLERERVARETAARLERERQAQQERLRREAEIVGKTAEQLNALGENYAWGRDGKPTDVAHAVVLFCKAADMGLRAAAFNVVNHVFHRVGDMALARTYARKAYELGQRIETEGDCGRFFRESTADLKARDERLAAERARREEEARVAAERARLERERVARETAVRLERERLEREAAARLERQRRAEQERLRLAAEAERQRQERLAREAAERARLERERVARETAARLERERLELEAAARLERERLEEQERQRRAEEMRGLTAVQLNGLGCSYDSGKDGKTKDQAHALTLFKAAQRAGLGTASYNVGVYALYGHGGQVKDEALAARCFQEAFERGYRIGSTVGAGLKTAWDRATEIQQAAERSRQEQEKLAQETAARWEEERQAEQERLRIAAEIERERLAEEMEAVGAVLSEPLSHAGEASVYHSSSENVAIVRGRISLIQDDGLDGGHPLIVLPEDEGERIDLERVFDVASALSTLETMGYDPLIFEAALARIDTEDLESKAKAHQAIRKIIHYTDAVTREVMEHFICSTDDGKSLRTDWVRMADTVISRLFHRIDSRSDDEILEAVCALNTEKTEQVRGHIWPQVLAVQVQMENPLDGSAKPVKEWDLAEVTHWCNTFKSKPILEREAQKLNVLAVVQRAVELAHEGKKPRTTQLLAVISNLKPKEEHGRFLQIATGEGKSITTAMTAAVYALCGETVDIASSSEPLSKRDAAEQKAFYKVLSLTCADVATEDNNEVKAAYASDVVYGTVHLFSAHLLRQRFQGQETRKDRVFGVLLADEVDSLLVDQIDVFTQLSAPVAGMEQLLPMLVVLEKKLDALLADGLSESDVRTKLLEYAYEIFAQLQDVTYDDMDIESMADLDETARAHPKAGLGIVASDRLRAFVHYQIPQWVNSVFRARQEYRSERDHVVHTNGAIRPVDYKHTGVVHVNQIYCDGVQQFLQLSSKGYLTAESLLGSFMSALSYVRLYNGSVFGVTGTLGKGPTRDFMAQVYGVDFLEIPTFKPRQFIEYAPIVVDSQAAWEQDILTSVEDAVADRRPVLVLCETREMLESLHRKVIARHDISAVFKYSRNDLEGDAEGQLPELLEPGQILLATNLAGRGTDIKLRDETNAVGGLHVCLTFMPLNERVEAQNFGRTSRQGLNGSGQLIVCRAHLGDRFQDVADAEIERLRALRAVQQKEKLDSVLAYTIPEGIFQDSCFEQVQSALERLREDVHLTPIQDAKFNAITELWALQYHMIRTYGEQVYRSQEDALITRIDDKGIKIVDTYYDRPEQLLNMIATHAGMQSNTLKEKLLTYVWYEVGEEWDRFEATISEYTNGSDAFFKACSHILGKSIVIIQQTGHYRIFRQPGDDTIVLGELTGGLDSAATLDTQNGWVLHDVLADGNCLFHAVGHQLRLLNHGALEGLTGSDPLHVMLRTKVQGSNRNDGQWEGNGTPSEPGAIELLTKELNSIIAVVDNARLDDGYTYYFYKDGEHCIKSPTSDDVGLPDLPIIKLASTGNHFKSVVQDPWDVCESAILPSVFDVIPYYRAQGGQRVVPTSPRHLLKRYKGMMVPASAQAWIQEILQTETSEAIRIARIEALESKGRGSGLTEPEAAELSMYQAEDEAWLKKRQTAGDILTRVQQIRLALYDVELKIDYPIIPNIEPTIPADLLSRGERAYHRAVEEYYRTYFEAEAAFVTPVIRTFLAEVAERYTQADKIILSIPALIQLQPHLNEKEWMMQLTLSMGSEPQYKGAAYYAHAKALAGYRPSKYKVFIQKALHLADHYVLDALKPWGTIQIGVGAQGESPLAKQVAGRLNVIYAVKANIEKNLAKVDGCASGNALVVGNVDGYSFEELGVITEDEAAIRSQGIAALYTLAEEPPKAGFFDIISMAFLGAVQTLAGVALMATGVGASLATTILSGGIEDLFTAFTTGLTGEAIDWGGYWLKKGLSLLMMAGQALVKSVSSGTTTFMAALRGSTEAVTTGEILKTAGWQAGRTVIGAGVSYGLGQIRESILGRYKEDIQATVRERIEGVYQKEGFRGHLSEVLAFDGISGQGWQVRAKVSHDLKAWEKDRIGPVLSVIENGFKLISAYHGSVSLSVALEAMSFTGGLGAQYAALVEFLSGYIEELERLMGAASREQVQSMDGVLGKVMPGIDERKRREWIRGLQDAGVLVGDSCHRFSTDPSISGWRLPEGVDTRSVRRGVPSVETALEHLMREGLREEEAVEVYGKREAIRSEVVKVTQRVFGIEDEIAVQAHGLVKWAGATLRAVMAPMGVGMKKDKAETTQRMVTAFEGKIRHGIAAHVQSGMQRGIMAGIEVTAELLAKAHKEGQRERLEGKAGTGEGLTGEEVKALQQLRAEDYRTLNAAKEKGEALSASEMERLGGYERERVRALEAEERRIQGVVDAIRADAAGVTGEAIARERSEAAARAGALRPAVARGTMPDSLGAIEALKAERTLRGIESLLGTDPRVLEGIVEDARPKKGLGPVATVMDDVRTFHREHEAAKDRYLPERGTLARAAVDAVVGPYSGGLTATVAAGSVVTRVGMPVLEQANEAVMTFVQSAARGAALRDRGIAMASHVVAGGVAPGLTVEQTVEGVDSSGVLLRETVGRVTAPVVGAVHDVIEVGTGSERAADVLTAPAILVATEGALRGVPKVRGALGTARSRVVEGSASVADLIRRFEIGVDRTVMGSGPAGIKVGLKPAVTEATAGESAAAVSAVSEAPVSYAIVDRPLFERTMIEIEGYQLPIDPITRVGPMGVDCSTFKVTSSTVRTKLGAPKDPVQFWQQWRSKYDELHPGIWSEINLTRLKDNLSPKVDPEWVRYFPEHSRFIGEKLEHHHLDHGKMAVALPKPMHRSQAYSRINHHESTLIEEVIE